MHDFQPEDDEDALFHETFGGLRNTVVEMARDLAARVKERVADAERTTPPVTDVVMGGVAEVVNVLARVLGFNEPEEPDDG